MTAPNPAIDAAARAMYAHEHVLIGGGDWDRIGEGERDYWRGQAAVAYAAIEPIVRAAVAAEIADAIGHTAVPTSPSSSQWRAGYSAGLGRATDVARDHAHGGQDHNNDQEATS
jgi:hypothetical protein